MGYWYDTARSTFRSCHVSINVHQLSSVQPDATSQPTSECRFGLPARSGRQRCFVGGLSWAQEKAIMLFLTALSCTCAFTGEYTMTRRTDIPGADIDCNYKDYKVSRHKGCQQQSCSGTRGLICCANGTHACQHIQGHTLQQQVGSAGFENQRWTRGREAAT